MGLCIEEVEKKVTEILRREKYSGEFMFVCEGESNRWYWMLITRNGKVFLFPDERDKDGEFRYNEESNTGQYAGRYYEEWPEEDEG